MDKRLKDRLLRENDLTLQKTMQICKPAELAGQQLKQFEMTAEVAVFKNKVKKQCRGITNIRQDTRKYDQEIAGVLAEEQTKIQQCQHCGYKCVKV